MSRSIDARHALSDADRLPRLRYEGNSMEAIERRCEDPMKIMVLSDWSAVPLPSAEPTAAG
jgi:hypothetical protein